MFEVKQTSTFIDSSDRVRAVWLDGWANEGGDNQDSASENEQARCDA